MMVSALLNLLPVVLSAYLVGVFVRRYFIMSSGTKKTNVPFLPDFNLLTGTKNIIFDPNHVLGVKAHEWHGKLGDNFGCFFGKNMQIFTKDLDLIYKVLVEDFPKFRNRYYLDSLSEYFKNSLMESRDDKWQTSRRAVGSVLKATKLKIDNVETDIDKGISRMVVFMDGRIKELEQKGEETSLDIYQINKNFFMYSLLKILFNADDLVDFHSDHNDIVEATHKFVNLIFEGVARACMLFPPLTMVVRPLLRFFEHGKYLNFMTDRLKKIMVDTDKKGEVVDPSKQRTIHSLIKIYKRGEISELQLIGNAVHLMMAGFATSIDTISALLWELAQHQDVQNKLRAELLQYGENSRFLEQCLNETMRLYPGALTNRDLSEDVYWKGMRLIKGSCLNVSLYSIHRDRKIWGPNADLWDPTRFNPEEVRKHHPAQFIPFGIGPRNCVGIQLARLEFNKYASRMLLRYRFEPGKQTQSKLEFSPLGALPFGFPIKGPIRLKVTPIRST